MLCHLLASYVIITCIKVQDVRASHPRSQPRPPPPFVGAERVGGPGKHWVRKREDTSAPAPCLGIQGANQDQVCLADHIKDLVWSKEKNLNTALNRKLHITNENKFIDEVLQLMHADGSDLLDNMNSEEQEVCRNNIIRRPKRLHISRVEEFENDDGDEEDDEGITRLPLMTMKNGNSVHISDFISLHSKHSKTRTHNDSRMSDLQFSTNEKSSSNKMITKLKSISDFYTFVRHHQGNMLNVSGEKREAPRWFDKNFNKDRTTPSHRTKQTVLKCSNIKHFKDVDNEFHKRNITTLMESNDLKRRRQSQIDKGDGVQGPVTEESVKDLSMDESVKRGAIKDKHFESNKDSNNDEKMKTKTTNDYHGKKKHNRNLSKLQKVTPSDNRPNEMKTTNTNTKKTSTAIHNISQTNQSDKIRQRHRRSLRDDDDDMEEKGVEQEGVRLRHNVTIPVFSIVLNEDSNVDARTLPIVKRILHENESLDKIVNHGQEGRNHVEESKNQAQEDAKRNKLGKTEVNGSKYQEVAKKEEKQNKKQNLESGNQGKIGIKEGKESTKLIAQSGNDVEGIRSRGVMRKRNITYDMTYEYVHEDSPPIVETDVPSKLVVPVKDDLPATARSSNDSNPADDILHNSTVNNDLQNHTMPPIYAVAPRNVTTPDNTTRRSNNLDNFNAINSNVLHEDEHIILRMKVDSTNETADNNQVGNKTEPSGATPEAQYTGVTHTHILSYTDLKEQRLHTLDESASTVSTKDEIDNLVSIRKFQQPSLDKVITVTTNPHVRENIPLATTRKPHGRDNVPGTTKDDANEMEKNVHITLPIKPRVGSNVSPTTKIDSNLERNAPTVSNGEVRGNVPSDPLRAENASKKWLSSLHMVEHVTGGDHVGNVTQVITPILKFSDNSFTSLYDTNVMDADQAKASDAIRDKSNALLGAMLPDTTNLTKSYPESDEKEKSDDKTGDAAKVKDVVSSGSEVKNDSKPTVDEEFHDEELDNVTVRERKVTMEIRDALQKAVNKAEDTLRDAGTTKTEVTSQETSTADKTLDLPRETTNSSLENDQHKSTENSTKGDAEHNTKGDDLENASHNTSQEITAKEEFQDALHSVDFDVDKIVPSHGREMVIASTSANVTVPTIEDDIDDLVEPKSTDTELELNETINKNKVVLENTTDHQGASPVTASDIAAPPSLSEGNSTSNLLNGTVSTDQGKESKEAAPFSVNTTTTATTEARENITITNSLGSRYLTEKSSAENGEKNNVASSGKSTGGSSAVVNSSNTSPLGIDHPTTAMLSTLENATAVFTDETKERNEKRVIANKQGLDKLLSEKSKMTRKVEKKTTTQDTEQVDRLQITPTYHHKADSPPPVVAHIVFNTPDSKGLTTKDAIFPSTSLTPASITPADGPLFPLLFSDENIAKASAYDNAKLSSNTNSKDVFANIEHIANPASFSTDNSLLSGKSTVKDSGLMASSKSSGMFTSSKDSNLLDHMDPIVTDTGRTNPPTSSHMMDHMSAHVGEPTATLTSNAAYRPLDKKTKNSTMDMLFFTTDTPTQNAPVPNVPVPALSDAQIDTGRFDINKYPELKPYILAPPPDPIPGNREHEQTPHAALTAVLPPISAVPPPLSLSKPVDLPGSTVASVTPHSSPVKYPEPAPYMPPAPPPPSRNNVSSFSRQLEQVGEEPPPTPNDPFLQQLAELSTHEQQQQQHQQQSSSTTISFHDIAKHTSTEPWTPSEDLIVPSFTSYDAETPPVAPVISEVKPLPPAPSSGSAASTYVSTLTPNEAVYMNNTLCSQVIGERKDGEEVPPDILQALAGCKPDMVTSTGGGQAEAKSEASTPSEPSSEPPSEPPMQMAIHEVVPSDEKPPSDKVKPDIVTQIAGPTLGSSTPNYNPDYAIQELATTPDVVHQLANDKAMKPLASGEPPIAYMPGYAITPLTDTKPDSAPPPAMERVKEDNPHLLEHKEVPMTSYATNQSQTASAISLPPPSPPPPPPPTLPPPTLPPPPPPTPPATVVYQTPVEPAASSGTLAADVRTIPATRMCKPGPQRPFYTGKPNCLIIGDSIALSYSYSVQAALRDDCQIQLSPSSKGGVALDSLYGEQCIEMFLSTTDFTPTTYDVIVFNFGLHDIDVLQRFPEEYNNLTQYGENLRKIKEKLVNTGASVAFALSTPVPFDKQKDDLLREYNRVAERIMKETPYVTTIDLYDSVTKECGEVPFETCYMMKRDNDVHYGVVGSIMLGKQIASSIKFLLDKRNREAPHTPPVPINKLTDIDVNSMTCPQPFTKCPAFNTCMENSDSRSGHACCPLPNAVDCRDLIHCCPQDTRCHPLCTDMSCSCIPLNQTIPAG